MQRFGLRDDQWERIRDCLPGREGHVGGNAADNRLFVEAVLYRYRTGIPWRDLPARFGDWKLLARQLISRQNFPNSAITQRLRIDAVQMPKELGGRFLVRANWYLRFARRRARLVFTPSAPDYLGRLEVV